MKNRTSFISVFAVSMLSAVAVLLDGALDSVAAAPGGSAVTLRDFAANWIIMPRQRDDGSTPILRLRLAGGHVIGTGAGGSGQINLWRLKGRKLSGYILVGKSKISLSVELNSDKGQLIIIDAPPQSEYDVALAWRAGYKPPM
jgi:hypothetical protein